MGISETLAVISDSTNGFMTKVVTFLSKLGLTLNNTQGKILNFIILIGLALGIIKIVERPVKWIFVILIIILALSIGLSLIS